jgi:hypothetical protein
VAAGAAASPASMASAQPVRTAASEKPKHREESEEDPHCNSAVATVPHISKLPALVPLSLQRGAKLNVMWLDKHEMNLMNFDVKYDIRILFNRDRVLIVPHDSISCVRVRSPLHAVHDLFCFLELLGTVSCCMIELCGAFFHGRFVVLAQYLTTGQTPLQKHMFELTLRSCPSELQLYLNNGMPCRFCDDCVCGVSSVGLSLVNMRLVCFV